MDNSMHVLDYWLWKMEQLARQFDASRFAVARSRASTAARDCGFLHCGALELLK